MSYNTNIVDNENSIAIRQLFNKLFDVEPKIDVIGVWIYRESDNNLYLNTSNYSINGESYEIIHDSISNGNLCIINSTINIFNSYAEIDEKNINKKEEILQKLLELKNDCINNIKPNGLMIALKEFYFNEVKINAFRRYMGDKFPWANIEGVWFNIYRDGRIEYTVGSKYKLYSE